jgi:hypothetical protein
MPPFTYLSSSMRPVFISFHFGSRSPLTNILQGKLEDNQNNTNMWAAYLMGALHDVTSKLDAWRVILTTMRAFKEVMEDTDSEGFREPALNLYLLLKSQQLAQGLRITLACSPPVRDYFRNADKVEGGFKLPMLVSAPGSRGYPEPPRTKPKLASLISLLRSMNEHGVEEYIPINSYIMADEILNILENAKGGTWMTDLGKEKVDLQFGTATIWAMFTRFWLHHNLNKRHDPQATFEALTEETKDQWNSQLGPSLKLIDVDWTDVVSNHLLPYPQLKFKYVGHKFLSLFQNVLLGCSKAWLSICNLTLAWMTYLVEHCYKTLGQG